jgi:DNA-binding protein
LTNFISKKTIFKGFLSRLKKGESFVFIEMSEENVVYIGRKPVMNYCLAVISSLQDSESEVALKARGRSISTAVDVAEVTRNRFMKDLNYKDVQISTEELQSEEGRPRNVSAITIILKKGETDK